jgi:PKD repeat protein
VAAVALAGCTVHQTEAPGLSGPSDLALSIRVTALPDSISQDGGSQSSIQVTAIGPDGKPKAAVALRMDMFVGGVGQDYGTLSARTIVTNSSGVANVVYTAPPSPTAGIFGTCKGLPGNCVEIVATASGSGFETAGPEGVTIRLVPPGVILPPADTPTSSFQFSPSTVGPNQAVTFDGSGSCGGTVGASGTCQNASAITAYTWDFGDGSAGTGRTVTHSYSNIATYTVTLTVTNDRGLAASSRQSVTLSASSSPQASFAVSPSDPAVNQLVSFTDTSASVTGRTNVRWDWNFGDPTSASNTASGQNVTHTFGTKNSFNVVLTVTDDLGQKTVATQNVTTK